MEENKQINYSNILIELAWEIKNSENLDKNIEVRINEINGIIKWKKQFSFESNSNLIKEYWEKNIETFTMLKEQGFQIIEKPESGELIIRYKDCNNFRLDDPAHLFFYEDLIKVQYIKPDYEIENYPKEVSLTVILNKIIDNYKKSELEYIEHSKFCKMIGEKIELVEKTFCQKECGESQDDE